MLTPLTTPVSPGKFEKHKNLSFQSVKNSPDKKDLIKHDSANRVIFNGADVYKAQYLTGLKDNSLLSSVRQLGRPGYKPVAFTGGRVYSLSEIDQKLINQREDGGYLLDSDTNTIGYFGEAAKNFLKNKDYFENETQIINPAGGDLYVLTEGKFLSISDPAAVLIGKDSSAKIKINKGETIVISTEKAPDWYERLGPEGMHKTVFDELVEVNKRLLGGHISKDLFTQDEIEKLIENGIARDTGEKFFKFYTYKNPEQLGDDLFMIGFTPEQIKKTIENWLKSKHRMILYRECGFVPDKVLPDRIFKKLEELDLISVFRFKSLPSTYAWKSFMKESELKEKIKDCGLTDKEQKAIVKVWKKTTRSGYDSTGLADETGKTVTYLLEHKDNIWNQSSTEWLVNSETYPGANEPFVVGVSKVTTSEEHIKPVDFKTIRPAECLHVHPNTEDRKQTEVYSVNHGEAALLTIQNGKPEITVLKSGDMAIINPGVPHCVMAIKGQYEHTVFQIPSAFQYGFQLKQNLTYKDFSLNEEDVLKMALDKLED